MDLNYSKDKPEILKSIWEMMGNLSEKYPHLKFGWNGFIIMVVE